MIIIGINSHHPDASVALVRDGGLVWAGEEERFSRVKHDPRFPAGALKACFEENGLKPDAVDVFAFSRNPGAHAGQKAFYALTHPAAWGIALKKIRSKKSGSWADDLAQALGGDPASYQPKIRCLEHHLSHAASAYLCSGFDSADIFSIDGLGDFCSAWWGRGEDGAIKEMGRVYFPHSAGFLYTAGTQFLGFPRFGDEYKLMGLAAYGKPEFKKELRSMFKLLPSGGFRLNPRYLNLRFSSQEARWSRGDADTDILYSAEWQKLFGKPRQKEEPAQDRHKNLAASLQWMIEEVYAHALNALQKRTGAKNLCLAGGVAFNSVANGKIISRTPYRKLFIQPAAGDAGTAIGAALYWNRRLAGPSQKKFVMRHAYLGSAFGEGEIMEALRLRNCAAALCEEKQLIEQVVSHLQKGEVVGWFQGRMEFGPRALGNRSILADPKRADMKDILNLRIKIRESFRPFAPIIPEEDAGKYFDMDEPTSPFMLKVVPVRPEARALIPAVTHVDGSARVQTVSRETHPLLWKLLKAFGETTGVPILINTSFNEHEPIVRTPLEAVDCFLKTRMDLLVLNHHVVERDPSLRSG